MIRLIIAGGRTFDNYELLSHFVEEYLLNAEYDLSNVEIVSGHCEGIDRLGERFAEEHNIGLKIFPAQWQKYGKFAGLKRNQEMIDYANSDDNTGVLIAFWDGKSRGTKYTIEHSDLAGMAVEVFRYDTYDFETELYEGITRNNSEEFIFDFDADSDADIVSFKCKKIYSTKINGNTHYYGYQFNADTDKSDRLDFLTYIKQNDAVDSPELAEMIDRCIDNFYTDVDIKSFDYLVKTPSSSNLVSEICNNIIRNFEIVDTIDLSKKPNIDLEFDYDKFLNDSPKYANDEELFNKFKSYMDKNINYLRNKEYFSISKNILPRYRKYIKPMVKFDNENYDLSNAQNILVVDDTVTTKSTFVQIIDLLRSCGYTGNIYLFSLMKNITSGKSR